MYQTGITRNPNKKATRLDVVRTLVRLGRRDLGLGQAGLAVVRALVLGAGDVEAESERQDCVSPGVGAAVQSTYERAQHHH